MPLTLLDAILALLILFGIWGGYRRGFLQAGASLVTLLAAVGLAYLFHPVIVDALKGQRPQLDPWLPPLAFGLLFVLVSSIVGGVAWWIVRKIPAVVHVNGFNRALGMLPGAINGTLTAIGALLIVLHVPWFAPFAQEARQGLAGAQLAQPAGWLAATLAPIFGPTVRQVEKALTVPPESTRSVPLDFRVATAQPRPELEARMLELVNGERLRQGLRPVQADATLAAAARAHSSDMLARGYFSHVTPEGQTLAQRLLRQKAVYLVAGENLALARNIELAHQGLMDSPGHRANILRPQFGHLGIGVLDAGRHGLMVTQNFSN